MIRRNNKIKVKKSNYWGYIDIKGNELIPCLYEDIFCRNNGFYLVIEDNKYRYLNQTGKVITRKIYDWIGDFNENLTAIKESGNIPGLAKYKFEDKRGYISKNGKEYWQYWKE